MNRTPKERADAFVDRWIAHHGAPEHVECLREELMTVIAVAVADAQRTLDGAIVAARDHARSYAAASARADVAERDAREQREYRLLALRAIWSALHGETTTEDVTVDHVLASVSAIRDNLDRTTAQRDECANALNRLAREARVPNERPSEVVAAVIGRLVRAESPDGKDALEQVELLAAYFRDEEPDLGAEGDREGASSALTAIRALRARRPK